MLMDVESKLLAELDRRVKEIERLKEAHRIIREELFDEQDWLNAEIGRLKALVETLRAANASFEGGMHWRNGLITKLCDALTRVRPHLAQPDLELITRAREATK
jgi:predicted nuclease with TOPRIM domain